MENDELDQALVGLLEAIERVREQLAHPPRFYGTAVFPYKLQGRRLKVITQDLLDIAGASEPIEVERLIRIIHNAAKAALKVSLYMDNEIRHQGKPPLAGALIPRHVALTYSYKLKECLESLAKILGPEKSRTPDWANLSEPPENPDGVEFRGGEGGVGTPPCEEECKITKLDAAFIYQRLRTMLSGLERGQAVTPESIAELLTEIREKSNVPA